MNVNKKLLKTKSSKISLLMIFVMFLVVCGYFIYENNRENEIIKNMIITFTDVKEVEYGTKDFDVRKELVKEVRGAELTNDIPKLDTTKIGDVTLKFTLRNSNVIKEIKHDIKVIDTNAPDISLETDSKEITINDEYDIKSNIKNVTDVVDGDIGFNEDVKNINDQATIEYTKLKKEDIKEDTKLAERPLNDFSVETTKDEDDKEVTKLYLKNYYYIDGSIDTSIAGEYKLTIIAVDKNGTKASKGFTVIVKEKEIEQNIASNVVSNSTNNQGSSSSNRGGKYNIGSIYDVVNTALAQIGKPYTYGGRGPDSFDCDGLILYAYKQNGYSMTSTSSTSGYSIGTNMFNAQIGDIIVTPNHVAMISKVGTANYLVEGMEVKYFTVVEASNPGTGIRENTYFPYMIRSDGVYLFSGGGIGTPSWSDIRRIK